MITEQKVITLLAAVAHRGFNTEELAYISASLKNGNSDYSSEAAEEIQKIILGLPTGKETDGELDPFKYLKTGAQLQEMEITINWLIEDLIPEASITTVIGPAGFGKSTVCLNIANAVDRGLSLFGRATVQKHVYVLDFENPLAVDVERARSLDLSGVLFWHTSAEVPPPRIDSPEFEAYKRLPPGLLIVDGHRASQRGDENSSKDTGLVMERWKQLRDLGFTIILIHHTQKANAEVFRGSQALIDQADHCLYFYPVRQPGSEDPVDAEDPDNMTYFLGTKDKTRFKACKVYLKRAGAGRFILAGNPDDEKIELLGALLSGRGGLTQTQIVKAAKDDLDFGKPLTRRLLKRGEERGIWTVTKGDKNSSLYLFSSCSPLYKGGENRKTGFCGFSDPVKTGESKGQESVGRLEFSSFSEGSKKTGKTGIEADPRYADILEGYVKTGMGREEAEAKTREVFERMGW